MKNLFVYATFGDRENAYDVVNAMVEQRLVSCANIFPPIESVYHWEGEIQQAEEVVVIFKTRAELFEQARAAICELHDYECPCVVALPIDRGHSPFMKWIQAETTVETAKDTVKS